MSKGKYIYYHCTNYHDNCKKVYIKEADLVNPLIDIFDKLKLPQNVINELVESLKKNEESKNKFHKHQLDKLRMDYDKFDKHLEVMYEDRLEGRLSTDEYDKRVSQYKNKQEELLSKMNNFKEANTSYYKTASRVLEIAKNSSELFKSSEVDEKRQILKNLLQNLELDGEKLSYELKNPYNMLFLYNTKTPPQREAFLWDT